MNNYQSNGHSNNGYQQSGSLREFYFVIFRHKWKILFFFVIVVFTVAGVSFLLPEIYQSEARMMVRLGRESVTLDPTASTGQVMHISQTRQEEVNSELEILESRDIAQSVVAKIGPNKFLPPPAKQSTLVEKLPPEVQEFLAGTKIKIKKLLRQYLPREKQDHINDEEQATLAFQKNVTVDTKKMSNILSISYESSDPLFAQYVVSTMIDVYLNQHMKVHYTQGSYDFFINQTEQVLEELRHTENNLAVLKRRTGIASIDDQRKILMNRIDELQREHDKNETELIASQSRVDALQQSLRNVPVLVENETITGNEVMRAELYRLQLKEQELLSKYAPDNIQVKEIRRQIQAAKTLLNQEPQVTMGINSTYQQLRYDLLREQSNLSALGLRTEKLLRLLNKERNELNYLNDSEAQIKRLERRRDIQELNYRKYSENLEQARIDQELQNQKISNISVIQNATLPLEPIRPKKLLNIILGIFLGIFGGVSWAFMSEYFDHAIKTPEDIENYLHIRTLATIPENKNNRLKAVLPPP